MELKSLWNRVLNTNEKALKSNSVIPFRTNLETYNHDGFNYELRTLEGKPRTQDNKQGPRVNPFQPWEKELEVTRIRNDHVLILNKYPVELGHLLLITNRWEPQNGWLTENDWEALSEVENSINGFWFFNNSENSGASQPHRHLQLLRRECNTNLFPRKSWFDQLLNNRSINHSYLKKSCAVKRRFCYKNAVSANELYKLYLELCNDMEVGNPRADNKPKVSHNLIITRDWISLIRRSRESFKGFNINALGFAGYFLITPDSDKEWLRRHNPVDILTAVVDPKTN